MSGRTRADRPWRPAIPSLPKHRTASGGSAPSRLFRRSGPACCGLDCTAPRSRQYVVHHILPDMLSRNLCCPREREPGTAGPLLVLAAHNVCPCVSLQPLQEGHQGRQGCFALMWLSLVRAIDARQCFCFHLQVDLRVDVGGIQRDVPHHALIVLMSTPARNKWTAVGCWMVWGLTRLAVSEGTDVAASLP
jgi:hypothetical protein